MSEMGPGKPEVKADEPLPAGTAPGRNWAVIIVVIAAVAIMILAGVYSARQGYKAYNRPLAAGGAVQVGQQAPDFTLQTLDGKTVHLSDFHGKGILLNFWATWCEPCKVEMPWFVDLQKQYAPDGFTVIGVALDDSGTPAIEKFAQQMGVNYPILQGKDVVGDEYGAQWLPTSVYIGRDGKVIDRTIGLVSHKEIEDNIRRSLAGNAQQASRGQ